MAFRDRLKVRSRVPSTVKPQENLSAAVYGFDGIDWLKLKVASDGSMVVQLQDPTGNTFSVNPDGSLNVQVLNAFSTEAKQNDLIALSQILADRVGDLSSPATGTILDLLGQMQAHITSLSFKPTVVEAETTLTSINSLGATVTLPWFERALIQKMTVILESGSTPDFYVEILRSPMVTERNVIVRHYAKGPEMFPRFDLLQTVPFINLTGLNELYVRIIPTNGTSNNFFVNISGLEAK